MSASDARERAILDSMFGSGSPATWYVGLAKTAMSEDGTGITEPVGGSYARVAVTNNTTNWPAATTTAGRSVKKNGAKITFPNPTAAWGAIIGFALYTASSGGTPEIFQLIDASISPTTGNTPVEFDIGAMEIEAD